MNGQMLEDLLKSLEMFAGVFSRNTLPKKVPYPCALVCNTDKASGSGEHWVAIYLDSKKRGEYFDSYGLWPLYKEIESFMNKNCMFWTYNKKTLQGPTSRVCGHYCTMYLRCKAHGHCMQDIIQFFGSDLNDNDKMVKEYIISSWSLARC